MIVINNWLKQPEAYDKEFWQYSEFNINELAFHVHDGQKGDKLPPSSLNQIQSTVTTDTSEPSTGLFYVDVAMPSGNTFDNTTISFFDGNDRVYLDYSRIDNNTYRVYSAYNNKSYGVRYA